MGTKDVTEYLRHGGNPERFATALDSGMPWYLGIAGNIEESEEGSGEIPESLYLMLPALLRDGSFFFRSGHERAVFLTSALPVVAGVLLNVLGINADGWGPLNIYTIIAARAGSGKGALRFARQFGTKIDERLVQGSAERVRDWQAQRDTNPDAGDRPPTRTFFLAGNSSARALADNLAANKGQGVIVESEIATLAATIGQDWGNFSDVLLKSFHGEAIALDRKNGEKVRIPKPAISMTLSGTPEALAKLISSTESGLFSRIGFYTFSDDPQWLSQRPKLRQSEQDQFFEEAAGWLDGLHQLLESRNEPLFVTWASQHWDWHDTAFRLELRRLVARRGDGALEASVKRAGVIAFRIGCILSVLRHYERGIPLEKVTSIEVHDQDAQAGIFLALVMYRHALRVAERMPGTSPPRLEGKLLEFYEGLPLGGFSSEVYREIARQRGIAERTARRYMEQFIRLGLVLKRSYGNYEKLPESAIENCLPLMNAGETAEEESEATVSDGDVRDADMAAEPDEQLANLVN